MLQAAHNDPVDHCFGMISTGQKVNERWKLITLVRTLVNKKKNALSILSWKSQRLSTRRRWMNKGDQAGHVTIWGQTSFSSRGKGFLISWCLYIHLSITASQKKKKKSKKKSSGLWVTLSFIKRGNNSYTVLTYSLHHGGMENSTAMNVLWDNLWVYGVVGGSLTLNEKKQQDGDR